MRASEASFAPCQGVRAADLAMKRMLTGGAVKGLTECRPLSRPVQRFALQCDLKLSRPVDMITAVCLASGGAKPEAAPPWIHNCERLKPTECYLVVALSRSQTAAGVASP
ncbi:hypothetical protein AAFF_G00195500 [Aldrovandia affinis]|uniref:Uncharacterized protein n=1 Tax=Aldrovandia affinis TaxID=143900 RepID=A0AAD7W6A0_9TELE|nr:hypothetical protein AAFF_G00195500 [Aldrovandia affinis]